jgi:hypothetical protein
LHHKLHSLGTPLRLRLFFSQLLQQKLIQQPICSQSTVLVPTTALTNKPLHQSQAQF